MPMTKDQSCELPTGPLGDAPLGQVSVNVQDVDRATAFYRDTLGIKHLFSAGGMAFFGAGETRLMLAKPEAEFAGPSSPLYFKVADIEAAHAELLAAGVTFRQAPVMTYAAGGHELWLAFFSDTEGNTHALMEERPTTV
ncbi:MAG: VOC family protein [Maricaulaceae bacterium]|jgi:methylmalonyl-CoA/ethylmalonyl-CoA epimerase